jgi:hypothetical protein
VTHGVRRVSWRGTVFFCALVLQPGSSSAAQQTTAGQSIGQVSTNGDLIVIELDRGALGQPNLFDLVGRTLRFTPAGARYRVTNRALRWETDYGVALVGSDVRLQRFAFPFSGRRWRSTVSLT